MRKVLTAVALVLTISGCAKGSDPAPSSDSGPAPQAAVPAANNTVSAPPAAPACGSVLRCAQQCSSYYPYTTTQEIERTCAAQFGFPSGGCTRMIDANQVLIGQYQACIALPADQVISYP